jgi:hypothetical protein
MHIKKRIVIVKCTDNRRRRFCFSFKSVLSLMPSMSIQKEEVRAVKAPSALGNKAEIKAIIKITEI